MKERPILFSAPMIRAILDSRKTQTRRVMHPQPPAGWFGESPDEVREPGDGETPRWLVVRCPYGAPGDRLWVRETLKRGPMMSPIGTATDATVCFYASDDTEVLIGPGEFNAGWKWQRATLPSIHMPRWASRITLEITEVRAQLLQEISEDDARAEGCESVTGGIPESTVSARGMFACLWDTINGKRAPWSSNPWVWALTFRRAP